MRRAGRITPAQSRALVDLWPRFGLVVDGPLDLAAVFGRQAPRVLEIGFGTGEALLEMAEADAAHDFVGIEVHEPGIGHLLDQLAKRGLANVRVIRGDAAELVPVAFVPGSLERVLVYFPDPWPKKRHHKRRLLQADLVAMLAARLRPGGLLHVATDWEDYAHEALTVLEAEPTLVNRAGPGQFAPRPAWRPRTRFERRGERLGHAVFDLLFERAGTDHAG